MSVEMENRVREVREEAGMTATALAAAAGVSRAAVSLIENHKRNPTYAVAVSLARALDCAPADLFPIPDLIPESAHDHPLRRRRRRR